MMTRSELMAKMTAKNPHLYLKDVDRILSIIFRSMTDALAHDDRIELRGFGTFSVRKHAARQGRNPRNGQSVLVPSKKVPHFKTGKKLHEKLNRK